MKQPAIRMDEQWWGEINDYIENQDEWDEDCIIDEPDALELARRALRAGRIAEAEEGLDALERRGRQLRAAETENQPPPGDKETNA